jgi:hypothetical protein
MSVVEAIEGDRSSHFRPCVKEWSQSLNDSRIMHQR